MATEPQYRYPWQVRRKGTRSSEQAADVDTSIEAKSTEVEEVIEVPSQENDVSVDHLPDSSPKDDLEELEHSVIDMERYVEELQFEMLKLRKDNEVRKLKMAPFELPFSEILEDLERISGSLETHKTDYSLVAATQEENLKLREELLQLKEEIQDLKRELDTIKENHAAQIEMITLTNEEKVTAMRNMYEEKLIKQSNQFTEMMEKEQANFTAQRDAWNEERATLLIEHANELASLVKSKDQKVIEEDSDFRNEVLRQITEVQNQAREQVAQLQGKIDQLLAESTSSRVSTRPSRGGGRGGGSRPPTSVPSHQLPWTKEAEKIPCPTSRREIRKTSGNSNCQDISLVSPIRPQGQENFVTKASGQKRVHCEMAPFSEQVPQQPSGVAAQVPVRKSLKVAAVPPVLVMAEEPHPLLEAFANSQGKVDGRIELPHSKWGKAADLLSPRSYDPSLSQMPSVDDPNEHFTPVHDWFDYADEQSQYQGEESQSQAMDNSHTFFLTTPPSLQQQQLGQQHQKQQQPLQQPGLVQKKRHLFTFQSGNN